MQKILICFSTAEPVWGTGKETINHKGQKALDFNLWGPLKATWYSYKTSWAIHLCWLGSTALLSFTAVLFLSKIFLLAIYNHLHSRRFYNAWALRNFISSFFILYLVFQQIFSKYRLYIKDWARHWRFSTEQDRHDRCPGGAHIN